MDTDKSFVLVDKKGVATIVKVSTRTVSRWHRKGQLPSPIIDDDSKTYWNQLHIQEWASHRSENKKACNCGRHIENGTNTDIGQV